MGLDHLGLHTYPIDTAKHAYRKTTELVGCSPPVEIDPRTHLNGPFVSLRKVQKHQDMGRLRMLEERRNKLRELLESDKRKYQCELEKQGLTLYTHDLF